MDNIARILHSWGIENAAITPIDSPSHTVWEVDGKYILKLYQKTDEAIRSISLSELLISEGVPVSTYVPDKSGRLISLDGLSCLMTKLPGAHINFFEQPELALVMGRELARLHLALAKIEPEIPCYDCNLLVEWREKYKPSVRDLLTDNVVGRLDTDLATAWHCLPHQLIHRDVHPQNVLFDSGKLTGWLDFDIGQKNARLFDVAYLLSGLLVGNLNNPGKIKIWRGIYHDILTGYDNASPLTSEERDALPLLMIVIECLFVWYWDTQNNEEQRGSAIALSKWLYKELF